jgi:hypothetical protein
MSNILEEYKAYYNVRVQRFENNPKYKHSYEAEKALNDLVQSCSDLSEIKDQMPDLSENCATALVKDEYLLEQLKFTEFKETVRILAINRVLEKADNFTKTLDLVGMIIEEENKGSIEISMDEANREFHHSWKTLDNIEIYANAEVPDKYKSYMQEGVQDYKQNLIDSVKYLEENNDSWQAGWKLTPQIITEYRHRRLLCYTDEHVNEQLKKYRAIVGR